LKKKRLIQEQYQKQQKHPGGLRYQQSKKKEEKLLMNPFFFFFNSGTIVNTMSGRWSFEWRFVARLNPASPTYSLLVGSTAHMLIVGSISF
jgi:hypothetical protein